MLGETRGCGGILRDHREVDARLVSYALLQEALAWVATVLATGIRSQRGTEKVRLLLAQASVALTRLGSAAGCVLCLERCVHVELEGFLDDRGDNISMVYIPLLGLSLEVNRGRVRV